MPHLSSLEVHLLRHPQLMSKIMTLLEKDNVRLRHMQEWRDQEQVFWKWMVRHFDIHVPINCKIIGLMQYWNTLVKPVLHYMHGLLGPYRTCIDWLSNAVLYYKYWLIGQYSTCTALLFVKSMQYCIFDSLVTAVFTVQYLIVCIIYLD